MARTEDIKYIFLLGSERSGSNLLTRIFDAHQRVCGPAPTHIGSDLLGNLQRYPDLAGADGEAFLDDFLGLFDSKMGGWKTRPDRTALTQSLGCNGPLETYLSLYRYECKARKKQVVFIKENQLYRWAPLLSPALPQIRFIYLCRDPRDMALSWKKAPALRGGVLRAAKIWCQDQTGFTALRAQLETATDFAIPLLRYEDLLDGPSGELQRICSILGLPFDPNMLAFHQSMESQGHAASVKEWQNIGLPLIQDNFGKYRDGLSKEEIGVIEATCKDGMETLGYEPGEPPLNDANLLLARKQLEFNEPWTKPEYEQLPEKERQRRARQHAVFMRIRNRSWRLNHS